MIYQQIPTIRLAHAARKLNYDGAWHPFGDDGRTFYRIVKNVMQRVRLEEDEDLELLALFNDIKPLPSKAARGGFKEEIRIRIEDDAYVLCNQWIRAYLGWELLMEAVEHSGGALIFRGANSLEFRYGMASFTMSEFRRALLLGKAVSIVAPQLATDAVQGVPHTKAEVRGLLHSAYSVLAEEIGVKSSEEEKYGGHSQQSLF